MDTQNDVDADMSDVSDASEWKPEPEPESSIRRRPKIPTIDTSKVQRHKISKEEPLRPKSPRDHLRKHLRLKGLYNDNYRELLNTTIKEAAHLGSRTDNVRKAEPTQKLGSFPKRQSSGVPQVSKVPTTSRPLEPSQIGLTTWSTEEKTAFFHALAQYGRLSLPRVASIVNKSEYEIEAYLHKLEFTLIQRAIRNSKESNSVADQMEVAVELSEECIQELDICADALAWYQFTWEAKQEHGEYGQYWLLDREMANEIELARKTRESLQEESSDSSEDSSDTDSFLEQDESRSGSDAGSSDQDGSKDDSDEEFPSRQSKHENGIEDDPPSRQLKSQSSSDAESSSSHRGSESDADKFFSANEDGLQSARDGSASSERDDSENDESDPFSSVPSAQLLKASRFVELSEKIFMNSTAPDRDWHTFQDLGKPGPSDDKLSRPEESPAIFRTAFDDFHRVAINLTKRIMLAALHQARSRLRAMDNTQGLPTVDPRVEKRDVLAALQILNLKEDSWDFWATLPQRHKLDLFYQHPGWHRSQQLSISAKAAEICLRSREILQLPDLLEIFNASTQISKHAGSHDDLRQTRPKERNVISLASDEELQGPGGELDDSEEDDIDEAYDQHLELLDTQENRLQERVIWETLGEEPPDSVNLCDIELPDIPRRVPKIEHGTSSFANWRKWTEWRPQWVRKEEGLDEEDDRDKIEEEESEEEVQTLFWLESQYGDNRQAESDRAVDMGDNETSDHGEGDSRDNASNVGYGKRRRTGSSVDLDSLCGSGPPSRKRREVQLPSTMEAAANMEEDPKRTLRAHESKPYEWHPPDRPYEWGPLLWDGYPSQTEMENARSAMAFLEEDSE